MLTINGTSRTNCSGVTRRELLQIGGAGLFGMTLPGVLAAQEAQQAFAGGKAKSVIFLFLFGGPSQLETFDMKPDAKREVRGPFKPIKSRTPDLLKVKEFLDDEALVVAHEAGLGRNAARLGALRCRLRSGREFSVGSGFSDEQRASPCAAC
jgi:hypothetical protein